MPRLTSEDIAFLETTLRERGRLRPEEKLWAFTYVPKVKPPKQQGYVPKVKPPKRDLRREILEFV